VSIHAFPNGNGRHARLATDLLCGSLKVALPTWGSESGLPIEAVRSQYIEALQSADHHDIGPLVEFLWT
jgi:fido (protein-threonine AMPylation protein)